MRILLDTNALLWVLQDSSSLGLGAREDLKQADVVLFSAVSVLEIVITAMFGKLTVPGSVLEAASQVGLRELAFTARHAESLGNFPVLVRHDPFDRMLLAQASSEGLHLLTSDGILLSLSGVATRDARD